MSTTKRTERKDEQLALNPVELLDLIIEEQMRMDMAALKRHKTNPKFDKHLLDTEEMEITTIKNQDEDTLKKRKIWSRWTKWSDCSVTCGDGTISRLRLCVSGRCAPGEHEEQRRLCNRAPSTKELIPIEVTSAIEVSKTDVMDVNKLNSLWIYHPASQQQQYAKDFSASRVKIHPRVTRLAKAHSVGYDPFFHKGYFEPFESRPKPVTLVALRKNGFVPRKSIKIVESKSSEVAELQSPYNDVGGFWLDEPGQS
ncbi:uncharacterized protein ACR2FA_001407 [Aphomia sociella]